MDNCVTHKAVKLMKTIISFTFLAMLCTLCAFILDLVGPTQRSLKLIHRNAIFSIIAGECNFYSFYFFGMCVFGKGGGACMSNVNFINCVSFTYDNHLHIAFLIKHESCG